MSYRKYGREVEEETLSATDLKKKAIDFNREDIGKVKLFSNETLTHYLAKSILTFNLIRMNHRAATEVRIIGIGQADVYDVDTATIYEIETGKSIAKTMKNKDKYKQAGVDLIIIQLHRWDKDLNNLNDFVREHIRPD